MLPFRGEFGAAVDFGRMAAASEAREDERLLTAVLADPHLAELDRDLRFADRLVDLRRGTFDGGAFLDRGRLAIAEYVGRAGSMLSTVFVRDANVAVCLEHKLISLAGSLASAASATTPPIPLTGSECVKKVFGRRAYRVPLTPVCGATIRRSDKSPAEPSRYAFRLSTGDDPEPASFGTARLEVGRSVFVDDTVVDPRTQAIALTGGGRGEGRIATQIIIKGVGPTRYANNRFSRRVSGSLTLLQAERDWVHSEALARGGVPVYRPLELALLPYCEWHPEMGWRPLVTYARLPLENLRVSDLGLLSVPMRCNALAALRTKVAACTGVPTRRISRVDIVRFFMARVGRIAGLCESGATFAGRPFFHGFLHSQNISLLGELVDLGEGRFVSDTRELEAAYAASGYVNPDRAWSVAVREATRETAAFRRITWLFAAFVSTVMTPGERQHLQPLKAVFSRAHAEGLAGLRADDFGSLLNAWGRDAS